MTWWVGGGGNRHETEFEEGFGHASYLYRVKAPVHIVPKEDVVRVGNASAYPEDFEQVIELAMNVPGMCCVCVFLRACACTYDQ